MATTFESEKTKDEIFNDIHGDKDVKKIASAINTCIFASAGQLGCDPSFKKAGKNLLTALFAYLYHYTTPSQQTMANVMLFLRSGQNDEGDDMLDTPLDLIFAEMQDIEPKSLAVKQYNKFRMTNFKTQQLVLAFCEARLKVFGFSDGKDEGVSSDESSRANQSSKNIVYYRRTGDDYNGLIFGGPGPQFREAGHGEPKNLLEKLNAYMAIQAWLNDKRLPRTGAMDELCRCLGCTKEELLDLQPTKCQEAEKDNIPRVSDNGLKVTDDNDELEKEALSIGMHILQHPELHNLFLTTIILRKLQNP